MDKLVDLFRQYDTPTSELQKHTQVAAKRAGWIPPWDRKKQREQEQKEAAGQKSGFVRDKRAKLRRSIVFVIYLELSPAHRDKPYSAKTIKVLQDEYLKILRGKSGNLLDLACVKLSEDQNCWGDARFRFYMSLFLQLPKLPETDRQSLEKVSHDTLVKDLKLLGVRSRPRTERSG
jgi:hypothetical protein